MKYEVYDKTPIAPKDKKRRVFLNRDAMTGGKRRKKLQRTWVASSMEKDAEDDSTGKMVAGNEDEVDTYPATPSEQMQPSRVSRRSDHREPAIKRESSTNASMHTPTANTTASSIEPITIEDDEDDEVHVKDEVIDNTEGMSPSLPREKEHDQVTQRASESVAIPTTAEKGDTAKNEESHTKGLSVPSETENDWATQGVRENMATTTNESEEKEESLELELEDVEMQEQLQETQLQLQKTKLRKVQLKRRLASLRQRRAA